MSVSRTLTQITWSSANSVTVTAGNQATSDAISMPSDAFGATVQVKADNSGTPASGDTLDAYVMYTSGDPDAEPDSADEYDTPGHARYLGQLDTNAEDPAILTFEISPFVKGFRLYVDNNSASNSVVVSAQMVAKSA